MVDQKDVVDHVMATVISIAVRNKAASHLIRVREWSELAKELPY